MIIKHGKVTWRKIKHEYTKLWCRKFCFRSKLFEILKYKKNIESKIIIFNVVPETIARINSYWKHYREFGNTLGFKPLYIIKKNFIITLL